MDERTAGRLELVGLRARRLLAPRTSNGTTAAESFDGGRGPPHAGDERRIATRIAAESSLDADSANAVAHDIVERAQSALDRMLADDWNGSLADEDAVALESVLHVRGRPALRVIGDRLESLEHHPGSEFWQDLIGDYEDRIVAATAATGAVVVSWFSSGNPPWVQGTAWLTAPNRVVTNRHVLMAGRPESHLVASASDGSAPKLKSGIELYLDFTHDHRAPGVQTRRRVTSVLFVAKADDPVDIAVLQIEAFAERTPLLLAPVGAATPGNLVVVGHPSPMAGIPATVQAVFGTPDGRKRASFGKRLDSPRLGEFVHDASTIGGYSGGPVVGISNGLVSGLHYFGDPASGNLAVAADAIREHAAFPWIMPPGQ